MAVGWKSLATDGAGARRPRWPTRHGNPTATVDRGCGPMRVGIGTRPTLGAGLRTIMAAGISIPASVGCGIRVMTGHRPGSLGAAPRAIAAGLPCLRNADGAPTWVSRGSMAARPSASGLASAQRPGMRRPGTVSVITTFIIIDCRAIKPSVSFAIATSRWPAVRA